MKCSVCDKENESGRTHCERCGTALTQEMRRDESQNRKVLIALTLLLFSVAALAYFFRGAIFPDAQKSPSMAVIEREQYEKRVAELEAQLKSARLDLETVTGSEQEVPDESDESLLQTENEGKSVIAGWVLIRDPWGSQIGKFRSGLSGNGWLALPARACLGGTRWTFYPDNGGEHEISGGLWIQGDRVGLWQLSEIKDDMNRLDFASWNRRVPVSWVSLESTRKYESIQLQPGLAEGFFIAVSLPHRINEIGMFMQDDKIVGWSFGSWLAKGYMWPPQARTDMEYKTWVKYFYDMTFAHGREEKFTKALAMKKSHSGLEQLAVFIEGFQLQPRLSVEDTPDYLLPEEIIKKMRVLVTNAVHNGEGSTIVEMMNSQVLKGIGDVNLLLDVVRAIVVDRGYEAAIREIEDSGRLIVRKLGESVPALDKLHLRYYQDWLQSLVADSALDEGWQTFNAAKAFFPDDPAVHLLGVELALLGGDWMEAERLLYMRDYPPAFQDRFQLLAHSITEMKGEEGKIVIRFPPGSPRVTVTTSINGILNQEFLVDTGATNVTIPSSTAEALGLSTDGPQRRIATAGGFVDAREVMINEIEMNGWVEYDIRAYVLDMPDHSGMGLLGLSYLGRFQMDLNPDQGTLLLKPR